MSYVKDVKGYIYKWCVDLYMRMMTFVWSDGMTTSCVWCKAVKRFEFKEYKIGYKWTHNVKKTKSTPNLHKVAICWQNILPKRRLAAVCHVDLSAVSLFCCSLWCNVHVAAPAPYLEFYVPLLGSLIGRPSVCISIELQRSHRNKNT